MFEGDFLVKFSLFFFISESFKIWWMVISVEVVYDPTDTTCFLPLDHVYLSLFLPKTANLRLFSPQFNSFFVQLHSMQVLDSQILMNEFGGHKNLSIMTWPC